MTSETNLWYEEELAESRARARAVEKMGCTCQGCGKQFRIDVNLSDEDWDKVRPPGKPRHGGLLCGGCIFNQLELRAAANDSYAAYQLVLIVDSGAR